jgi:hypothetical protein
MACWCVSQGQSLRQQEAASTNLLYRAVVSLSVSFSLSLCFEGMSVNINSIHPPLKAGLNLI